MVTYIPIEEPCLSKCSGIFVEWRNEDNLSLRDTVLLRAQLNGEGMKGENRCSQFPKPFWHTQSCSKYELTPL